MTIINKDEQIESSWSQLRPWEDRETFVGQVNDCWGAKLHDIVMELTQRLQDVAVEIELFLNGQVIDEISAFFEMLAASCLIRGDQTIQLAYSPG